MQTETALTLEQVEVEVGRLEGQLHNAQGQIKRAQARLAELAEQYRELAPQAFTGDEKAKLELEGIEDERALLENEVKLAQSAQDGLQKALEDAIASLKETRRKRHEARASEAYKRLKALEGRRDELVHDLDYVLREHVKVYSEYEQATAKYSQERANALASRRPGMYSRMLKDAFRHWL